MSTPKQFVEHYKRKLERCMDDENVVLDTIHKLGKVPLPADVLLESGVYGLMKCIRKKEGKVGYEAINLVNKWKSIMIAAAKGSEPLPAKGIDQVVNQNSEIRSSNAPLNFVNKLPVTTNHNLNWEKVCFQPNPVNKWDKNDSLCSAGISYENEQRSRSNSFTSHQENHLKISHNSDLDVCDSLSQSSNVHLITKDAEDQSANETSHYAKIIAPYSIDLKEGMFRAVKIKSEKPSRLSILKDYCSQEELVNCEIDYCSNSDYKKNNPSKKDANKVDDSKKGLNCVHKKEREKSSLDKSKLLNSSKREKDAVEKDSKLQKKGSEKNMIERDKTPVKSERDKTPVKSESDKTPVKSERDKTPVKSEKDKTPVKSEKDKTHVKSDKDKTHVKSDKDKTPVKSDKAHVKLDKDKTPVKSDKDKISVKSDKEKISLKSDREKISLKSDKDKISVKPEKEKSSVKSEKVKISMKSEKEKTPVKSEKDKIPLPSQKRKRESCSEYPDMVKNGKIKKIHSSSTESPNCPNGMKWKLHQVEVASSGETTVSETPPNENGKSAKKRELPDDEAAVFLSHKKERTSVYSGKKSSPAVLSLKEYCIHVLKKNIDSIKYLRKVPYNVLQPVLECCTPSQLLNLENHNKYLMDHTNELWKKFCQKYYKDEVPQKHETWRSVYLRANKGKEKKLKGIIASIAASKAKSQPERQLKLADAPVKYSQGNSKLTKNIVNAGSPSFTSSKVSSPLSASKISPSTSTAKVITESHIKYSHSNNKLMKGVVHNSSPSVSSSKISPPVGAPSVSVCKTSPPLSSAKVSKPQKKHKKAAEAPLMSKVKKSMGLYKQK